MSVTNRLALPFIDAAQSQKHVTHNEALVELDALVQMSVNARNAATPPATPAEGDRFLIGAAPSGAFAGQAGAIAAFDNGGWAFLAPRAGWRVYVEAERLLLLFDGTAWGDLGLSLQTLQNLSRLGVGTTADAYNQLSAKLNAALFAAKGQGEGGSGDLRVTLNKSASANTVSQLYQSNWSGRAETGLAGDDHFHVKVSADGATWREAINIDPATGAVALPLTAGLANGLATLDAGARLPIAQMPAISFGFRNRLRNPQFSINQRAVTGTVTLAAGKYGHDGVRAGAGGCAYTFAASGLDTTITITAGSLILPVEAGMIEGGVYTLSQAGGAQARVWQGTGTAGAGAYAPTPLTTPALAANVQTNVEFSAGSVLRPQLESGAVATSFERRPLSVELGMCQRYYFAGYAVWQGYAAAGANCTAAVPFPVTMRAAPTITQTNGIAGGFGATPSIALAATVNAYFPNRAATATGAAYFTETFTASAEL